ncbi:hypothetical protein Exig_2599 [Exiguobacterium sibiricum 255-15]|uniref:Uncharacterized protein n=1 Tax=Exiguobacterium sibiricum (strain DSM 17290 / CCUG 55495 / CIP 109462 / JCM 13490 / 255-15) TaxID=262543 RepID=B1YMI8_EXIS2|nr:hypothetical protein [Exiguobacterium sibiricum]ACB62048.1 hypothetical protein Exig_2599 [Exiguobacterium sibiricum 255-15]
MSNTFDSPMYDSIRSFVKLNFVIEDGQTIYLLDNMLLTKLSKAARDTPDCFTFFIDHFRQHHAVLLIPDIIFEESSRNRDMTPERYATFYQPFFQILSEHIDLFYVTFRDCFDFVHRGATTRQQAFSQFRLLAREIVRSHTELSQQVQQSPTIEAVESAIRAVRQDCGERILHLLACSLLVDGAETVTLLSNEGPGVYYTRLTMANNETLLRALFMEDRHVFRSVYRLQSLDQLLDSIVKNQSVTDPVSLIECIRAGQHKHRKVHYRTGEDVSDRHQLDNPEFLQIILDPQGRITF